MLESMGVGKQDASSSKQSEANQLLGIVEFHYTAPVTFLLVLIWSVEGRELLQILTLSKDLRWHHVVSCPGDSCITNDEANPCG